MRIARKRIVMKWIAGRRRTYKRNNIKLGKYTRISATIQEREFTLHAAKLVRSTRPRSNISSSFTLRTDTASGLVLFNSVSP